MLAAIDSTVASTVLLGLAIMAAVAIWIVKGDTDDQRDEYDWDI